MIAANRFPPQKVFYDGQIYDAFNQMRKFVLMAKSELIVIDPYFDDYSHSFGLGIVRKPKRISAFPLIETTLGFSNASIEQSGKRMKVVFVEGPCTKEEVFFRL